MEAAMRAYMLGVAAVLAAAIWAGAAAAAPCYVILDRNDTVIFRDSVPPFDLSDPKSPERAALRQRGQHLLIAEVEHCNGVGFISATTGGSAATVEDIVSQLKPYRITSHGNSDVPSASGVDMAHPAK
jgi:hypothetical protein